MQVVMSLDQFRTLLFSLMAMNVALVFVFLLVYWSGGRKLAFSDGFDHGYELGLQHGQEDASEVAAGDTGGACDARGARRAVPLGNTGTTTVGDAQ